MEEEWLRIALREVGKQPQPKMNLSDIVENIITGKDIESEGWILLLPEDWVNQFLKLVETAQRQGDTKRKEELAILWLYFSFQATLSLELPKDFLMKVEEITKLSSNLNSPPVESFVKGQLGISLSSYGFIQESLKLTKEAVESAKRGGLKWAELQWSINLTLLRMNDAPQETDQELRRLLMIARDIRDKKRIGNILNNLAFVNEQFLSNLKDAIRFQEEAVVIAREIGDRAIELHRVFHLAHMQEQVGKIELAIKNYDRGLAIDAEIGISDLGVRVFRHISYFITNKYREKTKEILLSHIKTNNLPHSEENIRVMIEQSEMGPVMSSWDHSLGSTYFIPDNSFANKLSVCKEWEALAVYAYQWMKQGFLVGDNHGFHWFSVALRNLGYIGAADESLQIAMVLPKAFKEKEYQWIFQSLGYEPVSEKDMQEINNKQGLSRVEKILLFQNRN